VSYRFSDEHQIRRLIAGLLFVLAALSLVSISLALWSQGSQNLFIILLRAPSRFFVASFHLAALYIPVVLAVAGVLLVSRWTQRVHLILLGGSTIPFFTLAIAVRIGANASVLSSPITAGLVSAIGSSLSTVGTAILAALEIAALVYAWHIWRSRDSEAVAGATPGGVASATQAGMKRIVALLNSPLEPRQPEALIDLPEPDIEDDGDMLEPVSLIDVSQDSEGAEPEEDLESSEPVEPLELSFHDGRFEMEDDDDPSEEPADDDTEPSVPKRTGKRSRPATPSLAYQVPINGILDEYSNGQYWRIDDSTRNAAETLRVTLEEFGIEAEVTGIRKGPVITMFEILPAPGVKLSRIVNLADNIALRLAASSVRIVAPIPGKHAVGIEIPNESRAIVSFAELLQEESFRAQRTEIPIALGKDIPGDAQIVDLTRMPHVLIAGATGSGKSVCVNSIICSILYRRSPAEVKLILIDPKIVELKFYNDIPHLLTPVVTDPKKAFQALQYCIFEMERRYTLLDALQVRDVQGYNRKIAARKLAVEPLPYIVVVVDEFADLMATSGKELESTLARLAAMSRAVGIHLVLATQRPSTDVITGLIKANIPSRIAFMVASKVDSRIIIDTQGAEKLLGRGDMLFTSAWDPFPLRLQGAYLSEEEVERVVQHVKQLGEPEYIDDEIFLEEDDEDFVQGELEDPLMEKAIDIVVTANKASASYLQRRLKVGYNRAARMVEEMERLGIVGPQQGSKPRDVIGTSDRV
jgi:S-DNA-T family DNA segregation ATPase FtsK/SpoIIIE